MTEYLIPILVIFVLIVLNGLFVAAEFAILAAPRTRIERAAIRGSQMAERVLRIQQNQRYQDHYIATAQVGITFASLGLGMYGESHVAHWLAPVFQNLGNLQMAAAHSVASVVAIAFLTYLHIVLGEMAPKSVALSHPVRTALAVTIPMSWFPWLTLGLPGLLNRIGNLILMILRVPIQSESAHVHTPEELERIVEESHETGEIGEEESEILVNLLHFSDIQVRKVMVPRTRVVGIAVELSPAEAVAEAAASRHTRYPVYDDNLDHIVGMLHVKELYRELRDNPDAPSLRRALRQPVFVPEQMTVEDLMVEFRRHRSQIAVVIDEYGGTSGIVSLEDVLEEIFGEVRDEFDDEEPTIQILGPGHALILGQARLDELAEDLNIDLQRPDVDTIGGVVQAELGRSAHIGDVVQINGLNLRVIAMEGLAISKLVARWKPPDHSEDLL